MKTVHQHNDLTKSLDSFVWVSPMAIVALVASIYFMLVHNLVFVLAMLGFASLLCLILEISDMKLFKLFSFKDRFGTRIFLRNLLSGKRLHHPSTKTI